MIISPNSGSLSLIGAVATLAINLVTPSLVQSNINANAVANTVTCNWSAPTTAGNLVLMGIFSGSGVGTSLPLTWQLLASVSGSSSFASLYYIEGSSSRSGTETFHFSGPIRAFMTLAEYTGVVASGSSDGHSTNSGTGLTSDSGSLTTTNANDLLVSLLGFGPNSTSFTNQNSPSDSFTIEQELQAGTTPSFFDFALLDRKVLGIGTYDTGTTQSSSSNPFLGIIAAFRGLGVPPTLTPTSGSLSFSGNSPVLSRSFNLSPAAGSLTASGNSPTLNYSYTLAAGSGSLSINGNSPPITQVFVLTPSSGAMSLTGKTSTLIQMWIESPNSGSFAISGNAPTLTQFGYLVPTSGMLTLTGGQASTCGTYITANVGSMSVAGYSPTLFNTGVPQPNSGSIGFTGNVPLVITIPPITLTPNKGTITLTGQPGTLFTAGLRPSAGSLALVGNSPAVLRGSRIVPNSGSLIVVGSASTWGIRVVPANGSIAIAGKTPLLTITVSTTAGSLSFAGYSSICAIKTTGKAGALSLSAIPPTITQQLFIVPTTGSISVNGGASTTGIYVAPSAGALSFTGAVPGTVIDEASTTGILTLTGYSPILRANTVQIAGGLALTGFAPVLNYGYQFKPGVGSLTFASSAGVGNVQAVENSGGMLLTGYSPNLISKFSISPMAGTLTVSSNDPNMSLMPVLYLPQYRLFLQEQRYTLNTSGLLIWQLVRLDGLNVDLPDSATATVTMPDGSTVNPVVTLESGDVGQVVFLNASLLFDEAGLYRVSILIEEPDGTVAGLLQTVICMQD